MIEIDDPVRRKRILDGPGGIEATAFLGVGGETILGVPEADADRTSANGMASSVQFAHFPFTVDQIAAFSLPNADVVLGFVQLSPHDDSRRGRSHGTDDRLRTSYRPNGNCDGRIPPALPAGASVTAGCDGRHAA